jgi:hypothetical protein
VRGITLSVTIAFMRYGGPIAFMRYGGPIAFMRYGGPQWGQALSDERLV